MPYDRLPSKHEIEEWCQELNKIFDENKQLKKENKELKQELLETIDALSDNRPNKKGFAGSGRFA